MRECSMRRRKDEDRYSRSEYGAHNMPPEAAAGRTHSLSRTDLAMKTDFQRRLKTALASAARTTQVTPVSQRAIFHEAAIEGPSTATLC